VEIERSQLRLLHGLQGPLPRGPAKKGLSNAERTAYHDQLGARTELNSRGDNATEVEESEAARDVQLIRLLRTSSSGFLEMARGFGWERLERKRRI
jgi:hypothetical protein